MRRRRNFRSYGKGRSGRGRGRGRKRAKARRIKNYYVSRGGIRL